MSTTKTRKPTAKNEDNAPEKEDTPDGPILDLSDAAVKKMIKAAKTRGFVTHEELNKVLPSEEFSSEQIEDVMSQLNEMGINVVDSEEEGEAQEEDGKAVAVREETTTKVAVTNTREDADRTDDPVRMYLREMGTVELLSREGEIAIAKRIEAGRDAMIRGLCESPLTFEAIMVWRDELRGQQILLRDIIDLEATYGAVMGITPAGQPLPGAEPVVPAGGAPAQVAAAAQQAAQAAAPATRINEDGEEEVDAVCDSFGPGPGHLFNVGNGLSPEIPVEGVAADPRYVDISVPPGVRRRIAVEVTRHAFAYVFAGSGTFRDASAPQAVRTEATDGSDAITYDATNHSLVLFDRGDEIVVQAGDAGIRFLLVSGRPLEEPVAWYGPIVMNTQAELQQAFTELRAGTFIKHT